MVKKNSLRVARSKTQKIKIFGSVHIAAKRGEVEGK